MNDLRKLWTIAGVMVAFSIALTVSLDASEGVGEKPEPQYQKKESTFFSKGVRERIAQNVATQDWAKKEAVAAVRAAEFWHQMSDQELWGHVFAPTLPRSWHVYSSGYCPSCKKGVPMYNWRINAQRSPWKVRCPHCNELFPKNDFASFYRSGLDSQGIFRPERADRSLLFNTEHPRPDDPLHQFGVDDGTGFRQGEACWRFVAAYLIYGQWKQLVLEGIQRLVTAYLLTGDRSYARQAAVLLDRVADFYPGFDFRRQAFIYDVPSYADGYVTVWHDACEETRALALAYDAIFEEIRDDPHLVEFLASKASQHGLANAKSSFAWIAHNIEAGLLEDPLQNIAKIRSNFPRTPFTQAVLLAVMSWEANREKVLELLDQTLEKATAVDGITGEKGLSGYAAFATNCVAQILAQFDRVEPGLLERMVKRHRIHETFRFHLDTWAFEQYYPNSGDCGAFARRCPQYVGVSFDRRIVGEPGSVLTGSMFLFLWRLYELTGDTDFVRVIYRENGNRSSGLPHDVTVENGEKLQKAVDEIIAREGITFPLKSVNKPLWCIALLRSGEGGARRVVWLDYDSGGGHGHRDGMNLGLFAYGLDLLPDFGYPPVQYGGWGSPRARWYMCTPAHNTVVVDGKDQSSGSGKTTFFAENEWVHAVGASAPGLVNAQKFDRFVVMVDISPENFYVVDWFQIFGGSQHDKFIYGHFGSLEVLHPLGADEKKLNQSSGYEARTEVQLRDLARLGEFSPEKSGEAGFVAQWIIEDRYKYLPQGTSVHMQYFELTNQCEAWRGKAWVVSGFDATEEIWIPCLMIRRKGEAPLHSAFLGVYVPFIQGRRPVLSVRRLPVVCQQEGEAGETPPDTHGVQAAALELTMLDGTKDLVVLVDAQAARSNNQTLKQTWKVVDEGWDVRTVSPVFVLRKTPEGTIVRETSFEDMSSK